MSSVPLRSLLASTMSFPSRTVFLPIPIIPDTVSVLSTMSHLVCTWTSSVLAAPLLLPRPGFLTSLFSVLVSTTLCLKSFRLIVLSSIVPFLPTRYVPSAPLRFPATFMTPLSPSTYTSPPLLSIFPTFLMLSVTLSTCGAVSVNRRRKPLLPVSTFLYTVSDCTVLSFMTWPLLDTTCVPFVPSIMLPVFVTPAFPSIATVLPSILAAFPPIALFETVPCVSMNVAPFPFSPICAVFITLPAFTAVSFVPAITDWSTETTFLLSTSTPSSLLYAFPRLSSTPFTTFPATSRYTSEPVILPPAPTSTVFPSLEAAILLMLYTLFALICVMPLASIFPASLFTTSPFTSSAMKPSLVMSELSELAFIEYVGLSFSTFCTLGLLAMNLPVLVCTPDTPRLEFTFSIISTFERPTFSNLPFLTTP